MKDKVIIYDDNCPMCCVYTKVFTQMGMLEEEGRVPFSLIDQKDFAHQLDLDKARHEIPLVDVSGKTTLYGLDSMLEILAQKIPNLVKIARFAPFYFLLTQLYKFISYNRKIIAAQKTEEGSFDCSPDFHFVYRLAYLVFSFGLSGLIIAQFSIPIPFSILILGGLFTLVSMLSFRKQLWNWLGHLGTSLLMGSLFISIFQLIPGIPLFVLSCFGITLIFQQLIHRIRLLG